MNLVAQELRLKSVEGFYSKKYPFFSFMWVRNIFVGRVKSISYGGDKPFINIAPLVGDCRETVYKRNRHHHLSGYSNSILPIYVEYNGLEDKLNLGIDSELCDYKVSPGELVAFELGEDGNGKTIIKSYFSIDEAYIQSVIAEFLTQGNQHYRVLLRNIEESLLFREYYKRQQELSINLVQASIDEQGYENIRLSNSSPLESNNFQKGCFYANNTWDISLQVLTPKYIGTSLVNLIWEPLPQKAQELYQLVS